MSAHAEPRRAQRPVYLVPFQQTGKSDFGDLAAYAATTVRLRIAELNLVANLHTSDDAPCRHTGVQTRAGSQSASAANPEVPLHLLITGTIETPTQTGKDGEYSLTYSLIRVDHCQEERLIQETVPFFALDALDRFRQMGDAIAFRLEEELTDRALVAVDPITPTNKSDANSNRGMVFMIFLPVKILFTLNIWLPRYG